MKVCAKLNINPLIIVETFHEKNKNVNQPLMQEESQRLIKDSKPLANVNVHTNFSGNIYLLQDDT